MSTYHHEERENRESIRSIQIVVPFIGEQAASIVAVLYFDVIEEKERNPK
jgi:hypothetical protein